MSESVVPVILDPTPVVPMEPVAFVPASSAAKDAAVGVLMGLTLTQEQAEAVAGGVLTGTPGIIGRDGVKYQFGVEAGATIAEEMT